MPITEEEFESWCFRNGGETRQEHAGPGILCWFPDADVPDRIHYFPDTNVFDVVAGGPFYSTRSALQDAEAQIDKDDRLLIDTSDTRVIIDPR